MFVVHGLSLDGSVRCRCLVVSSSSAFLSFRHFTSLQTTRDLNLSTCSSPKRFFLSLLPTLPRHSRADDQLADDNNAPHRRSSSTTRLDATTSTTTREEGIVGGSMSRNVSELGGDNKKPLVEDKSDSGELGLLSVRGARRPSVRERREDAAGCPCLMRGVTT